MSDSSETEQGTPAQICFFQKLHSMIKNESHTGAIDWLPDGDGFVIMLKNTFATDILPLYFGQAKYTSFTRRLKRWGFRRISNSGAYYHERFRKDMEFDLDADESAAMNKPSKIQGLPLKKRAKWMSSSPSYGPSDHSSDDINVMPQLMRSINRQKRKEKREEDQEPHQAMIKRSNTLKEAAQTLASLGQRESPRDSFDISAPGNCSLSLPPFYLSASPKGNLHQERFSARMPSHEMALMNHQDKVRRMRHSDLSHWTDNAADFSSLLYLSKMEEYNSLLGLCQLTSDSRRVPIRNLNQRKIPPFNRAA